MYLNQYILENILVFTLWYRSSKFKVILLSNLRFRMYINPEIKFTIFMSNKKNIPCRDLLTLN